MDIRAYIDTYVTKHSAELNLSAHTIKNKTNVFKRLLKFLGDKPITLETVNEYLSDMRSRNVSPISIKDEIRNFKAFTNYLYKKGTLKDNWGKQIVVPKTPRKPEALVTAEKAEEIIIAGTQYGQFDHILHRRQKDEMKFAMQFILRTGLRIGELLQIKGTDLYVYDDDPKVLIHSKGGNLEYQPLPADLLPELKNRVNRDRVFPVTRDTMNRLLQKGAKRVGISSNIHMHIHLLRKIYGVTLAKNGVHMSIVSKLMRHSNMNITQQFYLMYSLDELSTAQNGGHSIRNAMPETVVLENFIEKNVKMYFKNDSRFTISTVTNPEKRKITLKISY